MTTTHTYTYVTCDHPGDRVTADKLQGDSSDGFCVQWCQICGAVRIGRYVDDPSRWPEHKYMGDWDEPELRKIVGSGVRRA